MKQAPKKIRIHIEYTYAYTSLHAYMCTCMYSIFVCMHILLIFSIRVLAVLPAEPHLQFECFPTLSKVKENTNNTNKEKIQKKKTKDFNQRQATYLLGTYVSLAPTATPTSRLVPPRTIRVGKSRRRVAASVAFHRRAVAVTLFWAATAAVKQQHELSHAAALSPSESRAQVLIFVSRCFYFRYNIHKYMYIFFSFVHLFFS